MSTNIIFHPDCHQALTETLSRHHFIQAVYDTSTLNLKQMLSIIGLRTFINKNTGDCVVDSLAAHAPAALVTHSGLGCLAKYATSDDEQAPYVEFANDDGIPYERWVLTNRTWQAHTPVTQWAPREHYIYDFN